MINTVLSLFCSGGILALYGCVAKLSRKLFKKAEEKNDNEITRIGLGIMAGSYVSLIVWGIFA